MPARREPFGARGLLFAREFDETNTVVNYYFRNRCSVSLRARQRGLYLPTANTEGRVPPVGKVDGQSKVTTAFVGNWTDGGNVLPVLLAMNTTGKTLFR